MGTASFTQRATAVSLAFLLVSCSTTQHAVTAPAIPQALSKYAILFETQPDGTLLHTWKPVAELDLSPYLDQLARAKVGYQVERTSVLDDEEINDRCTSVYDACFKACMAGTIPYHFRHYYSTHPRTKAGRQAALARFCGDQCRKESDDCFRKLRRERQQAVEFSNAERAIDWIKRNKEIVVAGTLIVIAAVVFVAVVCASGGCVLLIPVILVADSTPLAPPYLAEVCQ